MGAGSKALVWESDGLSLSIPVIDAREMMALGEQRCVVDLRSPAEFALDHVPGAVNVPLFDDVQRALVGTLYRQVSPEAAFDRGREIVPLKVRALVDDIGRATDWQPADAHVEERVVAMTSGGYERLSSELMSMQPAPAPDDPVVLHCWRGGLRSRSVLALVRSLGLDRATLLTGGYKGYRAWVNAEIERAAFPRTIVLRGSTGVGKTLVLREIERLAPRSTLDLEALAGHRSSLLGMVGLEPCSQKMFESRLVERIARGFDDVMIVEGESRKVGDVILPPAVWSALSHGHNVLLETSVERRVDVLCADYLADERSHAELRERLPHVEQRMTRTADAPSLVAMLDAGHVDALVRLLLEQYYDPLYAHGEKGREHALRVDATDPARAARAILDFAAKSRNGASASRT
jgi:tRNA 2-selenouridine synthase